MNGFTRTSSRVSSQEEIAARLGTGLAGARLIAAARAAAAMHLTRQTPVASEHGRSDAGTPDRVHDAGERTQ